MAEKRDPYDVVLYPNGANPKTHPNTLAVIARLHGLKTAPVERCRVLEVGCNAGSNLIPMAYAIPGSEFVGVDLAAVPISHGQQRVEALGLTNVRLLQGDLTELGSELGSFDYIIAHGVYTWVPPAVRDGLLKLCRERLTANGVAFISYNALPGGHVREMMADLLQQGSDAFGNSEEGAAKAVGFLKLVAESRKQDDPLRGLMEKQIASLSRRGPRTFYHDELAEWQSPVSFQEFARHAESHGLRFVSESTMPPPNDPCFKPDVIELAKSMANGDPLAEEQVFDSFRMRMYRESVICHAEREPSSDLDVSALTEMRLSSSSESSAGSAPNARAYLAPGGVRMESAHAGLIALMELLIAASPESVPFTELRAALDAAGVALDADMFRLLAQLLVARLIDAHAWAAPVSRDIAERPRVSAWLRADAEIGLVATTLSHTSLSVDDPVLRALVLLADGTRDRDKLLQALHERLADIPKATLAGGFEPALRMLNRSSALVADSGMR